MAFLDLCRNPNQATSRQVPYLLVLQQPLFDSLRTRLVAPVLRTADVRAPLQRLHPIVRIADHSFVIALPEMAGVPTGAVGEVVGNLAANRDDIVAAIDFLVTGT